METERRKRFQRNRSAQQRRYTITAKDAEIMMLLARFRYLRANFIYLLTGRHPKAVSAALRKLYDHGYVDKPEAQLRGFTNLSTHDIYELDTKGFQFLTDSTRITRLTRERQRGFVRQFGHSMMICDTLASIELGIKDTEARLIPWTEIVERSSEDDPLRIPFTIRHNGEHLESKLVPDGLFGIHWPDGTASFFVLEAENHQPLSRKSLKAGGSTLKKMLAYQDIIQKKTYKQTGATNLRVLFVFDATTTAWNAKALAEEVFGSTNMFLFHGVPVQERIFKQPPPFPELLTSHWHRSGLPSVPLYREGNDAT